MSGSLFLLFLKRQKKPDMDSLGLNIMHNSDNTVEKKTLQKFNVTMASGFFTGMFCSALFNPWDRALYLSVKNNISFLSRDNFTSPYHGFSQAIVQRAFLNSIYFVMQSEMKYYMDPYLRNNLNLSEASSQFCIGMSAGSVSGALTNSISAIKYHMWGDENRSFYSSAKQMRSSGGIEPFFKGTSATMGRDMVFGSAYEVLRTQIRAELLKYDCEYHTEIANGTAAGIATIASGPLNYVRNMQYATPPHNKSSTTRTILKNVWDESKQHAALLEKMGFFQQRFRVGWGTARVAVGMAVSQKVFDMTCAKLNGPSKWRC